MCRINSVTNLLYPLHLLLIIDLYVRLRASHDEAPLIIGIINRIKLVILVEHDMFDLVAVVGSPPQYAAIEAGPKKSLLVSRVTDRGPSQARDWHVHCLVLDLMHAIKLHGRDNLQRAVPKSHCNQAGIRIEAQIEDVSFGDVRAVPATEVAEFKFLFLVTRQFLFILLAGNIHIFNFFLLSRCLHHSLKFYSFLTTSNLSMNAKIKFHDKV